jgi:hypothetical protein
MHLLRLLLLTLCGILNVGSVLAQMPFYTDDPDTTERGTWHFEFFNEFDGLQSSQYPNLNQNTTNFKLNYGLPYNLELDVDTPYLSIYRTDGSKTSRGMGDVNLGVKWNFRKASHPLSFPALAASLYIEFPTGNTREQLGSGLTDYWLNFIAQEPLTDKTRATANFGFLFAGNTSTGIIGIQTTRGHVFTGGLSLLHDFTPRLTLGGEVYGGIANSSGLGKDQLQGLAGGQYALRNGLSLTFALLGGSHVASPRVGGQVGFELDFPAVLHPSAMNQSFLDLRTSTQGRSR